MSIRTDKKQYGIQVLTDYQKEGKMSVWLSHHFDFNVSWDDLDREETLRAFEDSVIEIRKELLKLK